MAQGQIETWEKKSSPGVTVEAIRLNEHNVEEVRVWARAELVTEIDPEHPQETQPGLNVPTPTGYKRASLGMYVIKYGNTMFVEHVRPFEMLYAPESRPAPPPESPGDTRKRLGFGDPFDLGRMGP